MNDGPDQKDDPVGKTGGWRPTAIEYGIIATVLGVGSVLAMNAWVMPTLDAWLQAGMDWLFSFTR